MVCSKCGAEAKPLFTGSYCTKDCDKPVATWLVESFSIPRRQGYTVHRTAVDPAITFHVVHYNHPMPLYTWGCARVAYTADQFPIAGYELDSPDVRVVVPSSTAVQRRSHGVVCWFVDDQGSSYWKTQPKP